MSKIGLMGGTFDPIHNGHLFLAKQALTEFGLDRILFIPNHIPWMKSGRKITNDQDRVDMVLAAIANEPRFEISYIEMEAGGNSYTCNTVKQLCKEHPEHDYFFIMGADSLFTIEKWYHPEIIFEHVCLLVAVRDDCDFQTLYNKKSDLEKKYQAKINLMHMNKITISSTWIREHIMQPDEIADLLPNNVYRIIQERQLYIS